MKLYGGIYFDESGLSTSIRGMHMQTELMNVINENIVGFGKVGYQQKVSVISSFAEYIGVHGLSKVEDHNVGRIKKTNKPLDFALGKEGYFQYQTQNGIKLTRDGRFKLDKNGNLLTLDNAKVLGSDGKPVKFKFIPEKVEDIKVNLDGTINAINPKTKEVSEMGQISIVSALGSAIKQTDIRQGYVEESNVSLQNEFFSLVPVRRNFEANRQLFIIQNDELTKVIQELGRSS